MAFQTGHCLSFRERRQCPGDRVALGSSRAPGSGGHTGPEGEGDRGAFWTSRNFPLLPSVPSHLGWDTDGDRFILTEPPFRNPAPLFLSPALCPVPEWVECAAACED